MAQQKIFGYANRISVRPGEEISFHVNCDGASEADAQLVRLIHGDTGEAGPGHVEVEVDSPVNGRWAVRKQFTQLGSFLKVADPENKLAVSGNFSLMAFIWPTMPHRGSRQTILGRWDTLRNTGYALGINPAGHLEFWAGDGTEVDYVTAELPLLPKVWYLVGVSYDRKTGRAELYQEGALNRYNSLVGKVVPYDFASHVVQQLRFKPENRANLPFIIAGALDEHALRGPFVNDLYAGKIDRPAICSRALSRAEFDFSQFGGIEFHPDAVTDCGWEATNRMTVPAGLKSGIYAVRLRIGPGTGIAEEYIVFVVRPTTPTGKLCFLVPTASYLAYANESLSFDAQIIQPMTGQPPVVTDLDVETYEHREYGLSTYDHYEDDAGVCFSSYLRPIINMRPKYRMSSMNITWQFPADLSIVAWIDHMGYDCDFVTDEDLHREGADLLRPYLCVITGTHPEYVSEKMLDAQEDYVADGGRLIYMGGNGYYWVVGFDGEMPACMEVRKLDSGMRAWAAKPGEHYLQTTGEKSGLWRNRGRAPQKLTGVGFIAEGFETSAPYRKMPDAWHRTVSWITEGVEGEVFGDKGLAYNAAAGVELDRYDLSLGTPPHTKIIASSGGHSDNYVLVTEELLYAYAGLTGSLDYRIRADMTYFTAPNDGAVFSTGSIAYGQALPANGFNNSAARLLANVVNAFLKPGGLPGGNWTVEEKQWR